METKEKAFLCKCNNCDSILIDMNPQVGAVQCELTGDELEMQFCQEDEGGYWGCPVCMTDAYLIDL